MKKSSIDQEIRSRIHAFVEEVSTALKGAALEAVHSALGGEGAARSAKPRGRPRGRPAATAKPAKGKRQRRDASQVEELATRVQAYVKLNPGKRLEEIAKDLGIASKHLKLPVAKLLAARAVKTTGQKRGTKYHPSSGRPKARGKKRTGRRKKK